MYMQIQLEYVNILKNHRFQKRWLVNGEGLIVISWNELDGSKVYLCLKYN